MSRLSPPIYDASFEDKLRDLKKAIACAETLLEHPKLWRDGDNREGIKKGEFALGNWIVRPRFK